MKVNKANSIYVIAVLFVFVQNSWASASPITIKLSSEIRQQPESEQEEEEREKFYSNLEGLVNLESQSYSQDQDPFYQAPVRTIQSIQKTQNQDE